MFNEYQRLCETNQFNIGQLWLYKTPHKWILNFPTKKHWRQPSKIEYIEKGLKKFVATYDAHKITSISFPMLGCGNGELNWEDVRPLMEHYLNRIPIDVFIHLYRKDLAIPEHRDFIDIKQWLRSEPYSLPFSEVWDDIQCLLDRVEQFTTLDGELSFNARVYSNDDVEGILIGLINEELFLQKEDLLCLWQNIRDYGFYSNRSGPGEIERYLKYLLSILSKLDYLKPVIISRDYAGLSDKSMGLQLIAPINHLANFIQSPGVTASRVNETRF
jgi:hypothetical protein